MYTQLNILEVDNVDYTKRFIIGEYGVGAYLDISRGYEGVCIDGNQYNWARITVSIVGTDVVVELKATNTSTNTAASRYNTTNGIFRAFCYNSEVYRGCHIPKNIPMESIDDMPEDILEEVRQLANIMAESYHFSYYKGTTRDVIASILSEGLCMNIEVPQ